MFYWVCGQVDVVVWVYEMFVCVVLVSVFVWYNFGLLYCEMGDCLVVVVVLV